MVIIYNSKAEQNYNNNNNYYNNNQQQWSKAHSLHRVVKRLTSQNIQFLKGLGLKPL